jgi:hypothetical protein
VVGLRVAADRPTTEVTVGLMGHPLDGVREKITRAEAHLATVSAEIESHKSKCTFLARKQPNRDSLYDLYASFPEPGLRLSCVISDCLNNLRTALDYIVYELASQNGEPAIYNMFPIANTSDAYHRQVDGRDRLHDVPDRARAIIESLQPFKPGNVKRGHPLYILNRLLNTDKQQMLSLIVACRPRPGLFVNRQTGRTSVDEVQITQTLYNGVRVAEQRITQIDTETVTMLIERGLYIGFKDMPWSDSAIEDVLLGIIEFIKDRVVPEFEPFFEKRSGSLVSSAGR